MKTQAITNGLVVTTLTGCKQSFTMPIASSKFSPQMKALGSSAVRSSPCPNHDFPVRESKGFLCGVVFAVKNLALFFL